VALTRGGQSRLISNDTVGQEGDVLHLIVAKDAMADLEARLSGEDGGSH
jgi:hypothetical protein